MIPTDLKDRTRCVQKSFYYGELPIRDGQVCDVPVMITAWEPSSEELEQLNNGHAVQIQIVGTLCHPLMAVSVET